MKRFFLLLFFVQIGTNIIAQSKETAASRYIEKYKSLAIEEMNLSGIPASITLAQALHESASGTSQLAVKANNHFGVKCTGSWKGKKFYRNNNKKNNCFRKYENVEAAYKDRTRFLMNTKKYSFLFNYGSEDYKNWAKGLQRSGYAVSKSYSTMLLKTIKLYNLQQYDLKIVIIDSLLLDSSKQNTVSPIADTLNIQKEIIKQEPKKNPAKFYTVKKGDSLYTIAKKYKTSAKAIQKKNNLKSNLIKPGQKLKLP